MTSEKLISANTEPLDLIMQSNNTILKHTTKENETLLAAPDITDKKKYLKNALESILYYQNQIDMLIAIYNRTIEFEKSIEGAANHLSFLLKEAEDSKEKTQAAIGQSTIIISLFKERIRILKS